MIREVERGLKAWSKVERMNGREVYFSSCVNHVECACGGHTTDFQITVITTSIMGDLMTCDVTLGYFLYHYFRAPGKPLACRQFFFVADHIEELDC